MRKTLLCASLLAGWLQASSAWAQFGVNPLNQNNGGGIPNANFLPRNGAGYVGNLQSAFGFNGGAGFNGFNSGYGFNGFNSGAGFNGFNSGYGFNGGFNGFNSGFNGFNSGYGFSGGFNGFGSQFNNYASPFAAPPWGGNLAGAGLYNNPWQNPWGLPGNIYGPTGPFFGMQYNGIGNYAPIVGVNNGWWPYQPAYNPNNPVNQYLQNLYLQGLPNLNNLNNMPGNAVLPPRGP
jgi:hypothetical protein